MAAPVVEIDGLSKRFGQVTALDGLSLTVPRGAIFGFLGPNGAGKTTTINLLLGLMEPTSGTASVLGLDTATHAAEIRERVGALLDETGLYEQMTAHENLLFYARVWGMASDRAAARIRTLLSDSDLWERRHDLAGTLSTGMKQRLALARAQLHDPELLFLDEPTAGLDVISAHHVRAQLRTLTDQGRTVFLTTHNMTEAEELCARVAIINRGRLVAEGEPSALLSRSGFEVTIRGRDLEAGLDAIRERAEVISCVLEDGRLRVRMTTPDPSSVVSQLVAAGAAVHEVSRGTRLEEAFMELVEAVR